MLRAKAGRKEHDLAGAVVEVINAYIKTKSEAFNAFIQACVRLKELTESKPREVEAFILELLAPNKDARLFEIVSFAVLKFFYHDQAVYFGFDRDKLTKEQLKLYKTGRTNANDGGIDFVMKPLGRFFQVTETLDVKKYFLDIDKIERFPISFVIKSEEKVAVLRQKLEDGAKQQFGIQRVVESYMSCIEEIINIPVLRERFRLAEENGYLPQMLDEIVRQSRVEFNHPEDDEEED